MLRMKKSSVLLLLGLLMLNSNLIAQEINIGIRGSLYSEILESDRPYSVYLPPSYYENNKRNYPVLYIMDGDYNFIYVSGLIELQSSISENIPEMIVVGISGKGTKTYRNNCKPEIEGVEDSGNADEMLRFIDKELIPSIAKEYRVSSFKLLAGHSVGGLFVVNCAIKNPQLFDDYIAISPSLWWAENAILKIAVDNRSNKTANVYMSLVDEKGMGVTEFLAYTNYDYKFKHFPLESHNSVGEPTYNWALKSIFKTWKVDSLYFNSEHELKEYTQAVDNSYSQRFDIPHGVWYYTVRYILKEDLEELAKIQKFVKQNYPFSYAYFVSLLAENNSEKGAYQIAENLIKECLKEYPTSVELSHKLAEINEKQAKYTESILWINKAIEDAKDQNYRQWQINELLEARELTIKKSQ